MASRRCAGRAGLGPAELGGSAQPGGQHRVERSRAPQRPGRDQRALDARDDGLSEFPRAGAVHAEEAELEGQALDDDGERRADGARQQVGLPRALEHDRRDRAALGVAAPDQVVAGPGDVGADQPGGRARRRGIALDEAGLVAGKVLDRPASTSRTQPAFTKAELIDAVTELFAANDRSRIVPMLPDTFVLKIPATLPYGGEFTGPGEFDRFFARILENQDFWASFRTELAVGRVLDAGSYLVAPLKVTARPKSSDQAITVENLWLFEIADGNFVRAQLYADTAAARNVGR
jgi:hypothetical protein